MSKIRVKKIESVGGPLEIVGNNVIFSGNVTIGGNIQINGVVTGNSINNTYITNNTIISSSTTINEIIISCVTTNNQINETQFSSSFGRNSVTQNSDVGNISLGNNSISLNNANISNGNESAVFGVNNITGSKQYSFIKLDKNSIQSSSDYFLIFDDSVINNFDINKTTLVEVTGTCPTGTTVISRENTRFLSQISNNYQCDKYVITTNVNPILWRIIRNNGGISYVDCNGNSASWTTWVDSETYPTGVTICSRTIPTYSIPARFSAFTSYFESNITINRIGIKCCSTFIRKSAFTSYDTTLITYYPNTTKNCFSYQLTNNTGYNWSIWYTTCTGTLTNILLVNNRTLYVCSSSLPNVVASHTGGFIPASTVGINVQRRNNCCSRVLSMFNNNNYPVNWSFYDCVSGITRTLTFNGNDSVPGGLSLPICTTTPPPQNFTFAEYSASFEENEFCINTIPATGNCLTTISRNTGKRITVTTACTDTNIAYTGACVTYRFENFREQLPSDDNIFWRACYGVNKSHKLVGYRNYYDVCAIENSAYAISGITVTKIYNGCCTTNRQSELKVIHNFSGNSSNYPIGIGDGIYPIGDLLLVNNSLYGVAYDQGPSVTSSSKGIIFSCKTDGTKYEILHRFLFDAFPGQYQFLQPYAGLYKASNGKLYGTVSSITTYGSSMSIYYGGIYSFNISNRQQTNLVAFENGVISTTFPFVFTGVTGVGVHAPLMERATELNYLYGITFFNYPCIFKYDILNNRVINLRNILPSLGNVERNYTQLYESSLDPNALYGTSSVGGNFNRGTIFRYDILTSIIVIVYHFNNVDGVNPAFFKWAEKNGVLYGTTSFGGNFNSGTLFRYDPSGYPTNPNRFTKLFDFRGGDSGISNPKSLMFGSDGKIYGTSGGGDIGVFTNTIGLNGGIYSYDLINGVYNSLHTFLGHPTEPRYAVSTLVEKDGYLYGTSIEGGYFTNVKPLITGSIDTNSNGVGTVYKFHIPDCGSECVTYRITNNYKFGYNSTNDNAFWTDCSGITRSLLITGYTNYIDVCAIRGTAYGPELMTVVQINSECCICSIDPEDFEIIHSFTGVIDNGGVVRGLGRPNYDLTIENDIVYGIITDQTCALLISSNYLYNDPTAIFSCKTDGSNYEIIYNFNPGFYYPQSTLYQFSSPVFKHNNGKLYGTINKTGFLPPNPYGYFYSFDLTNSQLLFLGTFYSGSPSTFGFVEPYSDPGKLYSITRQGIIFKFDMNSNTLTELFSLKSFLNSTLINQGNLSNCFTVLYEMYSDLGFLYGTANIVYGNNNYYSIIFRYNMLTNTCSIVYNDFINLPSTGNYYKKLDFRKWAEKDGTLYGITVNNLGTNFNKTIFKYDLVTGYSTVFDFNTINNLNVSNNPTSIIIASNGKIYGTVTSCVNGICCIYVSGQTGSSSFSEPYAHDPEYLGFIYCYDLEYNSFSILIRFNGGPNQIGTPSFNSLLEQKDGKIYGAASSGGMYENGAIFRFNLPCKNNDIDLSESIYDAKTTLIKTTEVVETNASIFDSLGNKYYGKVLTIYTGITSSGGTIISENFSLYDLPSNTNYSILEVTSDLPDYIEIGTVVSNYYGNSAIANGINTQAKGKASHSEGIGTVAKGTASHAMGINATTNHTGEFALSNGISQYSTLILNGFTTGNTSSELFVDGFTERLILEKNTFINLTIDVSAVVVSDLENKYQGSGFVTKIGPSPIRVSFTGQTCVGLLNNTDIQDFVGSYPLITVSLNYVNEQYNEFIFTANGNNTGMIFKWSVGITILKNKI